MTQYNISSLALDPVINFGKVTVSTGYTTETAVALLTGHGARLPEPSTDGPFNLVWYNSSKYADPSDDPNVEIVRCTLKAVDSIIIIRNQENTSISNKNSVGDTYKMILAPTKKMFTDIPIDTQSRVNSSVSTHAALITGVHGAGASTIETIIGSQAKVDAHKDLTTGVHGAGASTIETITGSQSKVDIHKATGVSSTVHPNANAHIAAAAPHSGHEITSNKNAINGYAGLGADSRIAAAQNNIIVNNGTYGGNNIQNRAIAHGLGIAPKLIFLSAPGGGEQLIWTNVDGSYWAGAGTSFTSATSDATNFYVGSATNYYGNRSGNSYTWRAITW